MLAMRLERTGTPLVRSEIREPVPGPGQVLLQVRACAVCRTDLHVCDGELSDPKLPLTPGHEIIGTVIGLGPGSRIFQLGDRVGVPWLGFACGECGFCVEGHENLCDRAQFTGFQIDGGYSEQTVADERFCFRIPEAYNDVEAAPLMCAGLIGYRSLRMAGEGRRLGIFGFGAAAHIVVQVARFQHRDVYAFTRPGDHTAQDFARSLGACWAGDSDVLPPEELDAAIIFAPVGDLVPAALRVVRKGGIVVCGGIHMSDIPRFPYSYLWGERVLRSVANLTRRDAEEFLTLAPKANVKTTTEAFPLDQANTALDHLRSGRLTGAVVLIPPQFAEASSQKSSQQADPLHPAWLDALTVPQTYPHPISDIRIMQTHISWVVLTGEWAYKLKKPVNFGFVDFSTLELRRDACQQELRLNQRTASDLYDKIIPLTGHDSGPKFGGDGPTLEYAVRIRQFPQEDLANQRLARSELPIEQIESLARQVADLHEKAARAESSSSFGEPDVVRQAVTECLNVLDRISPSKSVQNKFAEVKEWTEHEWSRLRETFLERKRRGYVRECHGDLHLGNIVIHASKPTLFDCLEFNPKLRWIDIISDVAFLFMDLKDHDANEYAWRFLNTWFEQTGDYRGLKLLKYYSVYRALVRAKVAALRMQQEGPSDSERERTQDDLNAYVQLAHELTTSAKPVLILMHGVSGSGKSFVAREIASSLGAIQIRSDVERKRMFGVHSSHKSGDPMRLYSPRAIAQTYQRLRVLAKDVLRNGYPTVVDATFLRRDDRRQFLSMAEEIGVSTVIVTCSAPIEVLRERLARRQTLGHDPSDADATVLESQLANLEPLDSSELDHAVQSGDSREALLDSIREKM